MESCDINLLRELEPWCSYLVVPDSELIERYIEQEQTNTDYDLTKRLHTDIPNNPIYDIRVVFNPLEMTQSSFQIITQLPKIIKDSGSEGDSAIVTKEPKIPIDPFANLIEDVNFLPEAFAEGQSSREEVKFGGRKLMERDF